MTKSEKIQSSLAIFIAMTALMISVWQGCEQRRHNRLSVRPLLDFQTVGHNNTQSIQLANNGLGPAIVQGFYIDVDGQRLDGNQVNPWKQVIANRFLQGKYSEMYYFSSSSIIKPEQTYHLFTWMPGDTIQLGITVTIEYTSIYNEKYVKSESF